MPFWIFKKKEDKEAHRRIDNVHYLLKESFKNVKKDIEDLGRWQRDLHESHNDKKRHLENFEKRLTELELQLQSVLSKPITKQEEIKNEFEEAKIIDGPLTKDTLKSLTSTHQKIFITLYQLQKQLETNKISYKSLASVLYNNKKYTEVRSTLSQYISFLEDHGLVEKERKGKESFVGLTEPGFEIIKSIIPKLKSKIKPKL